MSECGKMEENCISSFRMHMFFAVYKRLGYG